MKTTLERIAEVVNDSFLFDDGTLLAPEIWQQEIADALVEGKNEIEISARDCKSKITTLIYIGGDKSQNHKTYSI
jgi:hypothetical protein